MAERGKLIRSHTELEVYQKAFAQAMRIFQESRSFPADERYSLTGQIRRSSRSVCANLAEAWRKRRYKAAFVSKLSDADAEGGETQTSIQFSVECGYLQRDTAVELYKQYDEILSMLVHMMTHPDRWILK